MNTIDLNNLDIDAHTKMLIVLMWDVEDLTNKLNNWLYSNPNDGDEVQEARDLINDARSKIREYIDHSYAN